MHKSAWMLASLLLITPLASAEIFKCALKDGVVRLQNFPFPIDWPDSTPPSSATASTAPTPPANDPTQDKKKPVSADSRSAAQLAASDAPKVGMTADEVRAVWGEPSDIYWDELVDGRREVWSFAGSRSVQFDVKGRAATIQR